jgi:hypothetical protein
MVSTMDTNFSYERAAGDCSTTGVETEEEADNGAEEAALDAEEVGISINMRD